MPLLVPRWWHSAAQTLTFPSHCCSDFSCRGSKPEMATGWISCKNWLISTLQLEDRLTEMATQCKECATHALMSELATKSCLNVSNPIWSSSAWISCQEAKMRCAWAALGNLSSVTCTQTSGFETCHLSRDHLEVCIRSAHLLNYQTEKVCPRLLDVNRPLALSHHHGPAKCSESK